MQETCFFTFVAGERKVAITAHLQLLVPILRKLELGIHMQGSLEEHQLAWCGSTSRNGATLAM